MRRILVIISCMLSTLMAMAQEYNLRWISSPSVDSTAQIWFRNQYVHHKKIKKAYVCIATTGYADLYINRRNASRNYLAPYRQPYSDYPVSTTYDITRFSRPDTTTIAVWYSPSSITAPIRMAHRSLLFPMNLGSAVHHARNLTAKVVKPSTVESTKMNGKLIKSTTLHYGKDAKSSPFHRRNTPIPPIIILIP